MSAPIATATAAAITGTNAGLVAAGPAAVAQQEAAPAGTGWGGDDGDPEPRDHEDLEDTAENGEAEPDRPTKRVSRRPANLGREAADCAAHCTSTVAVEPSSPPFIRHIQDLTENQPKKTTTSQRHWLCCHVVIVY